jgi:hypothetical protein
LESFRSQLVTFCRPLRDVTMDGPDVTRCPVRLQADAEERVGRVADERAA